MKDPSKTLQAQSRELTSLRERIAELELAESKYKRIEEKLSGSEQRLRGIIDNAQSGYFFIDRDGIYRQVNDAWLRMHKYDSPDEIVGRHFSATQVDADLGKAQRVVEGLLAGDPVPTGEFSRLCKDGSIGHHTFSASPVYSDHQVIGLEGFLTDATEQKKALDARSESERRFRSLFDKSLDAIQLGLPTGEILSANQAAQSLLGMTEEEICRAGRDGIVVQDAALALAVEEREKTGKWRGILTFRRKDGSTFPAEVSSSAFGAPNGPVRTITIYRDITERRRAEDDLDRAHERLRRLVDADIVGIIIAMSTGAVIETNDYYLRTIGYSREEFERGMVDWRAITPPEWLPADDRAIEEMRQRGTCTPYEKEYVLRDGTRVFVILYILMLPGPEEQIAAFILDITDRKRAENELRESERRYRDMLSNVELLSLTLDWGGRVTFCNDYLLRLTGWRREEVLGSNWFELFIPPGQGEELKQVFAVLLNDDRPAVWHRENEILTRSGERRLIRWNNTVLHSISGDAIGTASIGEDITDRKKAEEEVRFLSQVVEQSTDSIICTDAEFRIIYMNSATEKLYGWPKEELLGKTPEVLNAEPAADEIQKEIYESVLAGKAYLGEALNRRKDGSTFYCQFLVSPLYDIDGRLIGFIGSQRDVTDRRKAQDELATHRERLEDLVKERTKELEEKTQILEELNAATRALLRQREEDRRELEERFVANMKNLILPYAEKMKRTRLDERQTSYLGIMETHFNEIMSPLMRTMQQSNLTPTESQVASLIKDGKTTKDIADVMGIATSSIDTHRKSIRKKLGLSNAKVNLQSHLRSLGI
ncbi:MAG TPA: PAS domain S-box protein [Syntrophales bacterium]|nr:PAS domain S-box protein [Syntrophales bacterium]